MPLIRCPKCGQAYDIPGVIAVRLPSSIATCHCGEWLSGSKAAVLARLIDVDQIREIDMAPYRVDGPDLRPAGEQAAPPPAPAAAPFGTSGGNVPFGIREAPAEPPAPAPAPAPPALVTPSPVRSRPVLPRVVLVCIGGPLEGQEFEIPPSGLIVGREGHVRVPDEFLSRRHFELLRDDHGTVRVRDLASRNGTFLNATPAADTPVREGDEISAGVNRFRIDERS